MVQATRPKRNAASPPKSNPSKQPPKDGPPLAAVEPPAPPPASLYVRHALAVAESLQYLANHWNSYSDLIPERFLDGVEEIEIFRSMTQIVDKITDHAGRIGRWHEMTDALYRREHSQKMDHIEHEDVAGLAAIVRMHREAERRKDIASWPALAAQGIPPDVPSAPDRTLRATLAPLFREHFTAKELAKHPQRVLAIQDEEGYMQVRQVLYVVAGEDKD